MKQLVEQKNNLPEVKHDSRLSDKKSSNNMGFEANDTLTAF